MSFSRRDGILTVNHETSSLKRETKSPTFTIGVDDFLLHGKPFQIISGALHYFRVHPDLWADRIHKARLMGLNTIETYVPWNQHARSAACSTQQPDSTWPDFYASSQRRVCTQSSGPARTSALNGTTGTAGLADR
jgi:hypothetical protein